jgi:hypothetical protein
LADFDNHPLVSAALSERPFMFNEAQGCRYPLGCLRLAAF